jgi:hypothetical protein
MNQAMKKIKSFLLPLVLFALLAPLSLVLMGFKDDDVALSVIANEKGAPSAMTMRELKSVVLGEKQRWPDGTRISLAFMKTSTPAGNATARKLHNTSGDQFNKYWLALVFQGKASAPTFFSSAQELDAYVSSTPGAIGIVEASASTKSKSIAVDEKKSF